MLYALVVNGTIGPAYDTPTEAHYAAKDYAEAGNTVTEIAVDLAPCLVCGEYIPDTEDAPIDAQWHNPDCVCAKNAPAPISTGAAAIACAYTHEAPALAALCKNRIPTHAAADDAHRLMLDAMQRDDSRGYDRLLKLRAVLRLALAS